MLEGIELENVGVFNGLIKWNFLLFFSVLVYCIKKNLATLAGISIEDHSLHLEYSRRQLLKKIYIKVPLKT
jgi:hypothetical protein